MWILDISSLYSSMLEVTLEHFQRILRNTALWANNGGFCIWFQSIRELSLKQAAGGQKAVNSARGGRLWLKEHWGSKCKLKMPYWFFVIQH